MSYGHSFLSLFKYLSTEFYFFVFRGCDEAHPFFEVCGVVRDSQRHIASLHLINSKYYYFRYCNKKNFSNLIQVVGN